MERTGKGKGQPFPVHPAMPRWIALLGAVAPLSAQAAEPSSIDHVRIEGSSIAPALVAATVPYRGQAPTEKLLRDLAGTLAAIYARSDIAIYTIEAVADTPGAPRISVIEGHIEAVEVKGNAPAMAQARARRIVAPLVSGQPLRKRALQRAVRLIGDMAGVEAQVDLASGTRPGGLILKIGLTRQKPTFTARIDNGGMALLGRTHAQLSASFANIAIGGDRSELLYDRALDGDSWAAGFSYAAPIGTEGLSATVTATRADARYFHDLFRIRATGVSLGISYPLQMGERRALSASASFEAQHSDGFLLGYPLTIERTRIARIGLGWSHSSDTASTVASATFSTTINLPGAKVTREIADKHFAKLRLDLAHDRIIAAEAVLRARFVAQYSRDRLTSADMMQLGGAEFGRAFEPGWVAGDSGVAGSLELGWTPRALQGKRRVELLTYVDGGQVRYRDRILFAGGTYRLASAGVGARISEGGIACDLTANRALHDPFAGVNSPWRLTARVSLRFP